VVCIAFEQNVKKSFSRVKNDISEVKKTVNTNIRSAEQLVKRLDSVTHKEEFYIFIRRLTARLEQMESDITKLESLPEDIKDSAAKTAAVERRFNRQENIENELKEMRKLKAKISVLEGRALGKAEFNKELSVVSDELRVLKKEALTDKHVRDLVKNLAELKKRSEAMEKQQATKVEVDTIQGAMQALRSEGEKMRRDDLANIDKSIMGVSSSAAIRKDVEKQVTELKADLRKMKDLMDNAVSEVNMQEYVTKKEMKVTQDELHSQSGLLKDGQSKIIALADEVKDIGASAATSRDVEGLAKDVKKVSESLALISDGVKQVSGAMQKHVDERLRALDEKNQKEMKALKVRMEAGVKDMKTRYHDQKRGGNGGVVSKLGRGVSEFFREEPPQEEIKTLKKESKKVHRPERKSFSVEEYLGEKEKEKGSSKWLVYVLLALIVLALATISLFYFAPFVGEPAGQGANAISLANASVSQENVPGERSSIGYVLAAVAVIALLLFFGRSMLSTKESTESPENAKNDVELEKYFERKNGKK
jgi:hypothetical protein